MVNFSWVPGCLYATAFAMVGLFVIRRDNFNRTLRFACPPYWRHTIFKVLSRNCSLKIGAEVHPPLINGKPALNLPAGGSWSLAMTSRRNPQTRSPSQWFRRVIDGEQQRTRSHRLLTTREQGIRLQFLARRARHDINAGLQHLVLMGQDQVRFAAARHFREHRPEAVPNLIEGRRGHLLGLRVNAIDHPEQLHLR